MFNSKSIKELHEALRVAKKLEKLSYDKIAQVIGYSGHGTNKAMENQTLSLAQIQQIVSAFKLEKYFNNLKQQNYNVKELAIKVAENWSELREESIIDNLVELEVSKRVLKLKTVPGEFEKWLKL